VHRVSLICQISEPLRGAMDAELHQLNLPPLSRGFWLYAWKIVGPNDEQFCYVGMTGDVTGVAQSPFVRASAHLGFNRNNNGIRWYLRAMAESW